MEMEDVPSTRKRKSSALKSHQLGAAVGEHDRIPTPKRNTTHGQVPPPSGGIDRISDLPDAILGEIISLLPCKEGARTRILASKWRDLWLSAPLNLDCLHLTVHRNLIASVVSRIISSHPGPARRFRAQAYSVLHVPAATLDAWLRSPALDNLQNLEIFFDPIRDQDGRRLGMGLDSLVPAPASTFRCAATLREATFGTCNFTDRVALELHFPQLKQLALEEVSISQTSLNIMIARCPALECLLISRCCGFHCVRINSHSLRTLGVRTECTWNNGLPLFRKLVIENGPCLERLIYLERFSELEVVLISAPKLETLKCALDPYNKIVFGSTVIQGLHMDSLTTVMRTVKILAVHMKTSLDAVIDLMRCFPCLEKLYIQSSGPTGSNLWRRKHKNLTRSLDIRLKKLDFEIYRGSKSQVSFITFFVLNARELELMTLRIWEISEKFLEEQRAKIQLEKSASKGARFDFTTNTRCHRFFNIENVCDLNLADPFTK